jgi:coenzyme F420-reducing hydrogenase delta subunit
MKAFENGADGIIVSGCHPNDCHYSTGNFHARRRWIVFRNLLNFTGIETDRIQFSWVSAAEGFKWANVVNNMVVKLKQLGPNESYKKIAVSTLFNEEVTSNE